MKSFTATSLFLLVSLPWSLATAQTSVIHTVFGEHIGEEFGASVADVGDVNGDSIPDFAIGAPEDDDLASRAGKAVVFSGADGSVLHTFLGSDALAHFGRAVCSAGDINGDGRSDVMVSKPWQIGGGVGSVFTYSGLDGSLLRVWTGSSGAAFGHRLANMGDLNADGFEDIAVSAYLEGNNYRGAVHIVSGADGSLMHSFSGIDQSDQFGLAIGTGGDVDNDGTNDLIASGILTGPEGMAKVYSGKTGATLWTVEGDAGSDLFGRSVDILDDLDNDGHAEFAVAQTGRINVYSGASGTPLFTIDGDGGDRFGCQVARVGDADQDGVKDIAVGAYGDDDLGSACGSVSVFSGVDGSPIVRWYGFESDRLLGSTLAPLSDLDGDGVEEILAGGATPYHHNTKAGYARIYSGRCWGSIAAYGTGTPGRDGFVPDLDATGCPSPTAPFEITLTDGRGGASGVLLLGATVASAPFVGGTLLVGPPYHQIPFVLTGTPGVGGTGTLTLGGVLEDGLPVPFDVYMQALVLDGDAQAGIALSDALALEFR